MIWDVMYRYGHLPYRYGHFEHRYGIWSNDMGDDSIGMVISHIDKGYLVTPLTWSHARAASCGVP